MKQVVGIYLLHFAQVFFDIRKGREGQNNNKWFHKENRNERNIMAQFFTAYKTKIKKSTEAQDKS